MSLDVTIVIPTFHRRGYLKDCFHAIEENLPECSTVVAQDDGGDCTLEYNTVWAKLPYDSGLTAKRNAAVRLVQTEYTLMGCDDFDFYTPEARKGIIDFAKCLKYYPDVDVIAGRVNNRPYEGFLEYVPGEYIKEHKVNIGTLPLHNGPLPVWKIDIATNYFLARTEVLREIPWDETIRPIGGEHVDWFLDLKAANKTVAFLPFANINTQPYDASKQHPQYKEFRNRCWQGHDLMMKKRNIQEYFGFDQEVC